MGQSDTQHAQVERHGDGMFTLELNDGTRVSFNADEGRDILTYLTDYDRAGELAWPTPEGVELAEHLVTNHGISEPDPATNWQELHESLHERL